MSSCGAPLIAGAPTTDQKVVSRRLGVYWDITSPLIDFYRQRGQLIQINGEQPVDAVTRDILAAVGARIR